jgi:hypothetical protein
MTRLRALPDGEALLSNLNLIVSRQRDGRLLIFGAAPTLQ